MSMRAAQFSLNVPGLLSYSGFTHDNTLNLRKGLASARLGDSNCVIIADGDSNTTGHGAGTDSPTGYSSAAVRNMPFVLSKLLGNSMVPVAESTWGTQNLPLTTWATFDPRFSVGSSWAIASALDPSLGGYLWSSTGTGTPWSFTPQNPYDTVDIYFIANNSGLSNANVTINGVSQTAINPNTGTALQKVTYTVAAGTTGAIVVTPVSGQFYMVGVEAYSSAKKGIVVRNWAYDGGRATNFTSNGSVWSHLQAVKKLAPHCIIFEMMINDWNTGTGIATYKAQMQTIIASYLQTSDVILCTCFPTTFDTNFRTQANLMLFLQAIADLAAQFNLPVIDNLTRFGGIGTFAKLQTLGYTYNDFHMSAVGYADKAAAYANAINTLS